MLACDEAFRFADYNLEAFSTRKRYIQFFENFI